MIIMMIMIMMMMIMMMMTFCCSLDWVRKPDGQYCAENEAAITNAGDCSSAAGALGLQWAHSFEKAGDYPDCFFANDGCSSVYFNTSPNPSGNLNNFPDYGAVCHAPGT